MVDQFADAFRRYWAVIVTVAVVVAGAMLYAGQLYVGIRDEISSIRSEHAIDRQTNAANFLQLETVRESLRDRIESRVERLEERVTKLEQP